MPDREESILHQQALTALSSSSVEQDARERLPQTHPLISRIEARF
ncbi:MAG: hypothetical protein WBG19_06780 [Thermoplasmata archaeon]